MIRLIKVTQEHINKGTPECNLLCPIALALMEEYKTDDVDADYFHVADLRVDNKKLRIQKNQQEYVADFMKSFDQFIYNIGDEDDVQTPTPFTLRIVERKKRLDK